MKKLKITQRYFLPVLIVMVLIGWIAVPALAADPLSSWRDGTNKRLIIAFVEKVTTPDSPDFVAPENRVATFDMDGTVLLEKPAYSLFSFAIPLIKAAAAAQPELLERPHVKAIVDGDMKYFAKAGKFGPEGLYAALLETHSGKTEAQYAADANAFLFGQKHPRFQVPYAETVYLPMLEMIRYLKANGFRILDSFNLPLGSGEESGDKPSLEGMRSSTIWTSAHDLKNKVFYYHTQPNRQVRKVDVGSLNFGAIVFKIKIFAVLSVVGVLQYSILPLALPKSLS